MKLTNYKTYFGANKMSDIQAKYMDNKLKSAKNVDIICHDMTDRDSANSALAIRKYLEANSINSRVIISQKTPLALGLRTYDFDMVQASDDEGVSKITPDIAFCVDFGSKGRVLPNVYSHIKKANGVMGFDHHLEVDISRGNFIQLKSPLEGEPLSSCADFYSDTSAKSSTSIIYRFFEALGEDIDNDTAYDLFMGLADDANKRGLIECDGVSGKITPKKALLEDKNALEVYSKLKEKLSQDQIAKIAKTIDVMANLTPEQQRFKDSLKEKLRFSENKKIAYVEIPPDDELWRDVGGDNTITSAIMNRFRQKVLEDEKYGVDTAVVFYEAHGNYRYSIHSNKKILTEFYESALERLNYYPSFATGGHNSRGGGGMASLNPQLCHQFALDVIECLESRNVNC